MTESATFNTLIVMTAVLLIPALPAVLIYKVLPTEKVQISGKIFGLQVNAAGAFAGYFLLVLLAVKIQGGAAKAEIDAADSETWTISAVVRIEDPRDSVGRPAITFDPPLLAVRPTGRTTATISFKAPISRHETQQQLKIEKELYLAATYPVGLAADVNPFDNRPYKIKRDFSSKVMTILDTLVLRHVEPYNPPLVYSPSIIPADQPAAAKQP
jgi:hypothetical protein